MSHNLYLTLTGPLDVQKNNTAVYTVTMAISSGQKMFTPTQQETVWLMNNATAVLFLNGAVSQVLTSSIKYEAPGEFTISVRISNLSTGYSILVTVQNSTLLGSYMWGRESQSLTVVPYNPANPPNPLVQIATGPAAEIFYLITAVIGVLAYVYSWATRRRRELDDSIDQAGTGMEGIVMLKYVNNVTDPKNYPPLSPAELAIFNAIEPKVRDELVFKITSGQFRLRPEGKKSLWRRIRQNV